MRVAGSENFWDEVRKAGIGRLLPTAIPEAVNAAMCEARRLTGIVLP